MLLFIAFDLSGFFIGQWFESNKAVNIFKTASSLLQMPLFFLYVLSVCYSDFRLTSNQLVHTLLFLAFITIFWITGLSASSLVLYEVVGELQWLAYMIAVFIHLRRYKNVHQENHSLPTSKAYTWLFQFALVSCIAHSFVFVRWCFSYLKLNEFVLNMNIVISISTLLIITWFVFKALYFPNLFTGVQTPLKPIKPYVEKIKDTFRDPMVLKESIEMLQSFMKLQRPYLDDDLTLQKLATRFDMPEKELSILINHHVGKHFFDFINEYRIEEAKAILANPEEKERTILEILYQVGFSSKSSFYTAFKKVTDMTPTTYRKEQHSH